MSENILRLFRLINKIFCALHGSKLFVNDFSLAEKWAFIINFLFCCRITTPMLIDDDQVDKPREDKNCKLLFSFLDINTEFNIIQGDTF